MYVKLTHVLRQVPIIIIIYVARLWTRLYFTLQPSYLIFFSQFLLSPNAVIINTTPQSIIRISFFIYPIKYFKISTGVFVIHKRCYCISCAQPETRRGPQEEGMIRLLVELQIQNYQYFILVTLAFQSLPVTRCTNSLTFNNSPLCPHCIYMFYIYLRTNSDLCHLQHKVMGFYN